jgi:hypothetical protein
MGKQRVFSLLIVGGVISLAMAQFGVFHVPELTFYLLPTRAWELTIGVLVAFHLFDNRQNTAKALAQLASLLGILLIAFAVLAFDERTPWPSFYTLVPTLGTALVILFAREETFVGRLLSSSALVGIGLISYGAYLWHYPLFAFARIRSMDVPSKTMLLTLAITAMLLAYISWKYVEQPIRNRRLLEQRRTLFVTAAVGSCVLLLMGFAGYIAKGFPTRWDPHVLMVASMNKSHIKELYAGGCHLKRSDVTLKACVRGDSTLRPSYAIWGDSHAGALVHELEKSFAESGLSFVQYTKDDCPASLGMYVHVNRSCEELTKLTMRDIEDKGIETVIVASRWLQYVERGGDGQFLNATTNKGGSHPEARRILASYVEAIRSLLRAGHRVILIYPVPESEWDIPKSMTKLLISNDLEPFSLTSESSGVSQRLSKVEETFDGLGDHPSLLRVRPEKILCDTYKRGSCVTHFNDVPLYFDNEHLSNTGARLVVERIFKEIG